MGATSKCRGDNGGYRAEYAAALNTQLMNAPDTLQPVLVLAWQGENNATDREHLTTWAESRGVEVLNIDKFSFQAELDQADRTGGNLGAFIRLDIPSLIDEYGLFDLPNICQPEVLYTDSDVLFMNRISAEDMQYVKQAVSNSAEVVVAYGAGAKSDPEVIQNSGVMVIHVGRFKAEWPKMLEWAVAQPTFPRHDQAILNGYFGQEGTDLARLKATLPLVWNWKTYWPITEGVWQAVKVLHMHGPKPMKGLWHMAECNTDLERVPKTYRGLVRRGICCNQGMVAHREHETVESAMKYETVC